MTKKTTINFNYGPSKHKYGFGHLLVDLFLTAITGGLWLIVILIQFLRRR